MQLDSVSNYLSSSVRTPFFLFVGDIRYSDTKNELYSLGFDFIRLSEFCKDDKLPDIDGLLSYIEASDADTKIAVLGLGEYLALRGSDEAMRVLSRIKDIYFANAKVVLFLRGMATQIPVLQIDPRFDSRRFDIIDEAKCDLSFVLACSSVRISSALSGFKKLLEELENGKCGNVVVTTIASLDKALFTVREINNSYEGIKFLTKNFNLQRSCGSDDQWAGLLSEIDHGNDSIGSLFEKYRFSDNLDSDFYSRISGNNYRSWLYFIYLKNSAETLANNYMRFVLEKTNRFEDFADNVLNAIINISHDNPNFSRFYQERKLLAAKFPDPDVADFVINNRRVISESIYRLTDTTDLERREIIAWVSQNGLIPEIENIYPTLSAYLKKYIFKNLELADLLTEYFEAYKRQKLSNNLEADFLKKVDMLAHTREFNQLPTRNEIIDRVDTDGTFLYWIDALGVEYLSLIETLARERDLSVRVNIARAKLPTITAINKDFYDAWFGKKEKNEDLDDIKHKDKGGYNFQDNQLPIHFAKELDIIEAALVRAATELRLGKYKRFIIASDHGASRLAVLRKKEEKYDTDNSGEHSGRCCKLFQSYDLPFAAEENGYLVLADYGRFRGGRAANVEVHGGASLEEVIVPIIELSLKNANITVKPVDENVMADFRAGAEIKLFFNLPVQNISVILNGKSYPASQISSNHYSVKLPDMKRAGDYRAEVYAGDDFIGNIIIKAQSKSGKVNDAFDDLL